MPVEHADLSARVLSSRYRFDRPLAAGGMAQVWEATDLVLARRVAIKVLRPDLAADPAFARRFRREARAAARLNHPGIVQIFDTYADAELEAIVMEYIAGETLRARLDHGPMSPHEAVGIAAQVADSLDAAHQAGLVHRDVKPANILLCAESTGSNHRDGVRVVVTDFGIAKALVKPTRPGHDGEPVDETDLTAAGMLLGTAKYLSPEQISGGVVDGRTDIYALGVVLYEAVCGRPPFTADTDLATALARLQSVPLLPRQIRPDLRRDLEAVIMRCLEIDPDRRFASASELRAALIAADPGPSDDTIPGDIVTPDDALLPSFVQSERRWLLPAVVVVAIAIALGAAGVAIGRTSAGRAIVDRALGAVSGDNGSATTSTTVAGTLLPIAAVSTLDPFSSDGDENPDAAPRAVDGDLSTSWRTDCYLGDLNKQGVGFVVSLAGAATLQRLELDAPRQNWTAEVYVAERASTTLAGWGQPVATVTGSATTLSIDLGGRSGGAVLLWITSVANIPAGNCGGYVENSHYLELAEVRVRGQ